MHASGVDELRGAITIGARAARAVRTQRAPVRAGDVLDCSGAFAAGDRIYVVVRGVDGGQGLVGTGAALVDAHALRRADALGAEAVVLAEGGVAPLWPR